MSDRPSSPSLLRRAAADLAGGLLQLAKALGEVVVAALAAVGLTDLFEWVAKRSGPLRRLAAGAGRGALSLGGHTRELPSAAAEAARAARSGWTAKTWAALLAIGLAALLPLAVTDPLRQASFGTALYVALAAVGLNVAVGLAGMASLGQGAFVAVGAFGAALLSTKAGWDAGASVLVAVVAASAAGLVVGWGASRLRGPFVAVATWVVSWLMAFALVSFPALSGGAQGLVVPEGRLNIPWTGVGIRLTTGVHYEIALILLALALLAFAVISHSPTGLALAAVRRGPAMASVAGVRPRPLQLGAFTASAAVGGLAGAMVVQLAGVADPTAFGPLLSAELFVAVLLGGEGTVFGPVFGAAVLSALPSAAHGLGGAAGASKWQPVITSGLLLAALLLGRGGVPRLLDRRAGRLRDGATIPAVSGAGNGTSPTKPKRRPRIHGSPNGRMNGRVKPILSAKGLTKRFGGVVALDDLSLAIPPGQIHAIIGPNGSGKTTFLRVVAGAVEPDAGKVSFDGRNVTTTPPWERFVAGLARTPAHTTVMPDLTALEHVQAGTWAHRQHAGPLRTIVSTPRARAETARMRARAEEVLALAGLAHAAATPVGQLNGAEQRLVMLATAYASGPRLMLVDEPSSGLSGPDAQRVTDLLLVLRSSGATILLVEHNLQVVRAVADVVTVLDAGSIIAQGTPGQVARRRVVLDAYLGDAASQLAPRGRRPGARRGR